MLWVIFWIVLFLFFIVSSILLSKVPDPETGLGLVTNVVRAFSIALMFFCTICILISCLGMVASFMSVLQTNGVIHIY